MPMMPAATAGSGGGLHAPLHIMPTFPWTDEADEPEALAAAGAPPAPAVASGNMFYHGGPIQKTPAVYLVFWGWEGVDPSGIAPYATAFFSGVGGSGWANIQTQYDESTSPHTRGYITNPTSQLAGVWYDNDPVSVAESMSPDLFLTNEALRAESHFGYDQDATYMIFTATGRSTAGFGVEFCAWHTAVQDSAGRWVAFANIPYMTDMPFTCPSNAVNSGSSGDLDAVSIVAGHEYAEAVTDPVPITGWTDSSGGSGENGDKCAWLTSGPGRMQNIVLSTGTFAVQGLWSNASSSCAITYSAALSADAGGPYSGTTGSSIAISASGAGGSSPYTCAWSGTGATFASASSCSTTVTYSSSGTKTLSVTVTDSASATATDTATVTVSAPSGTLAADAGGPYTGTAASSIAITGSATGGTAPYSCAWSGTGATFGSASSCSTTVRYASAGTYTVSLTVTDASSATATDTATVTVGASAPTCYDDYAGDGLQASSDPTGLFEITRVCAQTIASSSVLRITIETPGMALENALGAAASPVVYTAYVDGFTKSWSAAHGTLGAGWTLRNDGAGTASGGTASSTSTALTIDIPLGEIDATSGYLPSTFAVRTRTLNAAGVQLNLDTAGPNTI